MRMLIGLVLAASLVAPGVAQTQTAPVAETATQFYLRYRALIPTATDVDQVVTLWSADVAREFNASPTAERVGLDELKRIYQAVGDVTVVKEVATRNAATLSLEGTSPDDKRVIGTARLTKENGAWKVAGPEQW